MEQSNRTQRSEVWEQIYNLVKKIPQADTNGCDAPDAPSVATDLEKLFLKLLPIQHVSNSEAAVCPYCKSTKYRIGKNDHKVCENCDGLF